MSAAEARQRIQTRHEEARAKDGWVVAKGELVNGRRQAGRLARAGIDLSMWEAIAGLAEFAERPWTREDWAAMAACNGAVFSR